MNWNPKWTHRQLWWKNGRGLASCAGVTVELRNAPRLDGLAVISEVSYLGAQPTRGRIEIVDELARGLTDAEAAQIEDRLQRMALVAREVWT